MKRLMAVVLVLSLCLFALSVTSPLVFGGGAGEVVNGDTNGDGDRDISDATYYLRWLFQGGPEPVEIACPADQGDRVVELETQLAAVNAENAAQAEQMTALQDQLAAANAANAGLQEQLAACPDDQSAAVAELEAQLAEANTVIENLQGEVGGDVGQCSLAGANLQRADLGGANLERADLRGVDLSILTYVGSRLGNCRRRCYQEFGPGLVLPGAGPGCGPPKELPGDGLQGQAVLAGANLRGADLTNANLLGVDLSNADLRDSVLVGASFWGADLTDADLANANLQGADLRGVRGIINLGDTLGEPGFFPDDLACELALDRAVTVLPYVNLQECDFTGERINEKTLTGANFSGSILTDGRLNCCLLDNANLSGVVAVRTDFRGADLTGANLEGADLRESEFNETSLQGANLRAANLQNADLSTASLEGVDLRGADLTGAQLLRSDLDDADLRGAILRGANLQGADLQGADLTGADVQDANFSQARGVNLEGTIGVPRRMP